MGGVSVDDRLLVRVAVVAEQFPGVGEVAADVLVDLRPGGQAVAGEDRVVAGLGGQRVDGLLPAGDVVVAQVEVDVVVDEILGDQDALLGQLDEEFVGGPASGDGLEENVTPSMTWVPGTRATSGVKSVTGMTRPVGRVLSPRATICSRTWAGAWMGAPKRAAPL
ncbi:hypothetical protein IQ62_23225 [Streptomyces scabiei]|nr:hypothetical protein IQ62_23225 [Streptomyces scabiei]